MVGHRPSLTAQRYLEDILEEHVVLFPQFVGPNIKVMHDNARPHSVAITHGYFTEVSISSIDWPTKSPDLNTIEHMLDSVQKCIRRRNNSPNTPTAAVMEGVGEIQRLFRGMRRRLQEVIHARGGNIRY